MYESEVFLPKSEDFDDFDFFRLGDLGVGTLVDSTSLVSLGFSQFTASSSVCSLLSAIQFQSM